MTEDVTGGVRAVLHRDASPAPVEPLASDASGVQKPLSNVNIAEEMSGMMPTEIGYRANLESVRIRDGMPGTLLDLLA